MICFPADVLGYNLLWMVVIFSKNQDTQTDGGEGCSSRRTWVPGLPRMCQPGVQVGREAAQPPMEPGEASSTGCQVPSELRLFSAGCLGSVNICQRTRCVLVLSLAPAPASDRETSQATGPHTLMAESLENWVGSLHSAPCVSELQRYGSPGAS